MCTFLILETFRTPKLLGKYKLIISGFLVSTFIKIFKTSYIKPWNFLVLGKSYLPPG